MKNNILFAILVGSLFLISCGTAHHASYNSQNFVNGIYYTPDPQQSNRIAEARGKLGELAEETKNTINTTQESRYDQKTGVETIYVGDTNMVSIDYNPFKTYLLTDDMLGYQARMEKYNSPLYSVTIEFSNPYIGGWYPSSSYCSPWGTAPSFHFGPYYGWYDPWYYGHRWYGPGWYDPWYYGYRWYGPGWYDPWYAGWYDPFWGPGYYPGFYPGGHPGFYPPMPPHHIHGRDVYYGKRENSGTAIPGNRNGGSYTRRDGNANLIRGNNVQHDLSTSATKQNGNKQGSSYRRGATTRNEAAINNSAVTNKGTSNANVRPSNGKQNGSSGTMYRRSAQPSTRSSAAKSNEENRNNNSYNRNNNSNYGRSSNPAYNRSNNSSTHSSGYNSTGTQRSSGSSMSTGRSGSSYRR